VRMGALTAEQVSNEGQDMLNNLWAMHISSASSEVLLCL
jgi:hypothetical protein